MTILPMLAGLAAAVASFVVTPVVVRWAHAHHLFCMPDDDRRIHSRPVPRLGGIAVLAGVTVGVATALALDPSSLAAGLPGPPTLVLVGLVAGGGIAFGAGLIDDLRGMRPAMKLTAQLAAALIAWLLGFRIEELGWGGAELSLAWASLPVTLLWIVGVTNAYNLVDGMDGLATGLGIIAFSATLAASATLGHGEVAVVAAALLGALLGFLPHNFNPARIFLGDSGSLFVGFVLAVLSVQGAMKSSTAVLVAVPLFALAMPLLDTLVAMARRWLRGLPISKADARHIHHRLLSLGLSHRDAVLVLYVTAAAFAGLGILMAFAPPRQLALIAVLGGLASTAVLVAGMRGLGYDEFLLAGKVLASGPRRARQVIRDRILADDLAAVIGAAGTLEEIQAVLADAAQELGLLHAEICGEADTAVPEALEWEPAGSVWKLDFPLCDHENGGRELVLRMRIRMGRDFRPAGAERVASVLGPAIRERLDAFGTPCGDRCARLASVSGERSGIREKISA